MQGLVVDDSCGCLGKVEPDFDAGPLRSRDRLGRAAVGRDVKRRASAAHHLLGSRIKHLEIQPSDQIDREVVLPLGLGRELPFAVSNSRLPKIEDEPVRDFAEAEFRHVPVESAAARAIVQADGDHVVGIPPDEVGREIHVIRPDAIPTRAVTARILRHLPHRANLCPVQKGFIDVIDAGKIDP